MKNRCSAASREMPGLAANPVESGAFIPAICFSWEFRKAAIFAV
ncbi:hypothetical protein [Fluviicola sp.]|nr:hypothetical protein [Fluviicola sp.]